MAAREVHSVGQVFGRAGRVLGVTALILFGLWALTSSTGKRFFVEWGGQQVEVTPIPSAQDQKEHY